MLSREENDLLTRVGSETPAGQLLRRYWQVVAAASELSDEKPKKRVRVLGEDLVLFRNQKRRLRSRRGTLLASRRLPLLRICRGGWHPVSLSRLEVRSLWQMPRTAL